MTTTTTVRRDLENHFGFVPGDTQEASFRDAIIDAVQERDYGVHRAARLVYADWLQEHGFDRAASEQRQMAERPFTPGYDHRLIIRFSKDKKGRPLAHYWGRPFRNVRISYTVARDFIAHGWADEEPTEHLSD